MRARDFELTLDQLWKQWKRALATKQGQEEQIQHVEHTPAGVRYRLEINGELHGVYDKIGHAKMAAVEWRAKSGARTAKIKIYTEFK